MRKSGKHMPAYLPEFRAEAIRLATIRVKTF